MSGLIEQTQELEQGTRVQFNIQGFEGKGKVVGLVSIGRYIIESDNKLDSEVYKYSHFCAFHYEIDVLN